MAASEGYSTENQDDRMTLRVLHLTTVRKLYEGQRRQLEFEVTAAQRLQLPWTTRALHVFEPVNAFERRIPRIFRSRLLLRTYSWIYAIKHRGEYDVLLLRDQVLDLAGPIFARYVPNRVTVHHSKELEELSILRGGGWLSKVASLIERGWKPVAMRTAMGLAGVTAEIRDYEVKRFPHLKNRAFVFPNGFDFTLSGVVDDQRSGDQYELAFICAEFSEWHGLDRLIEAAEKEDAKMKQPIIFHLIGELTDNQMANIRAFTSKNVRFIAHGHLAAPEIRDILAHCHGAVGSLALDRQGLREASTLKVRDYLAAGLPVYATHQDSGFSESFPYFLKDHRGVSLQRLQDYLGEVAHVDRAAVRTDSAFFIDKGQILAAFYGQLGHLFKSEKRNFEA